MEPKILGIFKLAFLYVNNLKFLKFKCLCRKHKRQTEGYKIEKEILSEREEKQREIKRKRGIIEA